MAGAGGAESALFCRCFILICSYILLSITVTRFMFAFGRNMQYGAAAAIFPHGLGENL